METRKKEYTAQCWGGPEHGNLVSAKSRSWTYVQISQMFLDGIRKPPSVSSVLGMYCLDYEKDLWIWKGPGADGDTIERIRRL